MDLLLSVEMVETILSGRAFHMTIVHTESVARDLPAHVDDGVLVLHAVVPDKVVKNHLNVVLWLLLLLRHFL